MEQSNQSVVVITHAAELDFSQDYVSLPREYGTAAFDARRDVQAIRSVVFENLARLDEEVHFTPKIRGRTVIIKPNLVTVFHDLGMLKRDYPESTDPRLIDAVVLYLLQYTSQIVIAESSGRGMPTRVSFRAAGLDRLARFRKVELVALEEQPTDRYFLPKARVMHEIVIPRIFSQVVRGEAFYISMPKMKTNLFTGVTLGNKNAMGLLSYNLRQHNHTYQLDQKLVDLLHLIKPDLVLIDGIMGGEGNCPAPVEPVQSRVVISGNHGLETDRVATRMMGIDPATIPLIRTADENGFGDPAVKVIGVETVTPYRPADPSLVGPWMKENFPRVKILIGHERAGLDLPDDGPLHPAQLCAVEGACRSGCLATTRYAFDMLVYEGVNRDFDLTLIIGSGVRRGGDVMYFDAGGQPVSIADIGALKGKKVAIGSCARPLKHRVDRFIDGCMPFPNSPHMLLHQVSGTPCSVMSLRNRYLVPALIATLQLCERRKALLRTGQRIDIPLRMENYQDQLAELSEEECLSDYLLAPFKSLTPAEIKALCDEENRTILATFFA